MLKFLNTKFTRNYNKVTTILDTVPSDKLNILLSSDEIKTISFHVYKTKTFLQVSADIEFQKDNQQSVELHYKGDNINDVINRVTRDLNKCE